MTGFESVEVSLLACVNDSVLGVRCDDVARALNVCEDRAQALLFQAEQSGLVQRLHQPVSGEFFRVPAYVFRLTTRGRVSLNRPGFGV